MSCEPCEGTNTTTAVRFEPLTCLVIRFFRFEHNIQQWFSERDTKREIGSIFPTKHKDTRSTLGSVVLYQVKVLFRFCKISSDTL